MATIVILEHQFQRGLGSPYILHELGRRWHAAGHQVLVHCGLENPPEADLAILHVDLTLVPPAYLALLQRYPKVLNAGTGNIAKSSFSKLIIQRDSGYTGPVIVKTDANFGGKVDRALQQFAARAGQPAEIAQTPVLDEYPIANSPAELPKNAWTTPGIIVEKFMPERDADGFYLRMWTFFGRRERSSRYCCDEPVIKASNVKGRSAVAVPEALRALRKKLGFDYGKFDYVLSDGHFYLLDVNRTPGAPAGLFARPDLAGFLDDMALGIEDFL